MMLIPTDWRYTHDSASFQAAISYYMNFQNSQMCATKDLNSLKCCDNFGFGNAFLKEIMHIIHVYKHVQEDCI